MNETRLSKALVEIESVGLVARRRELAPPLATLYQRILLHFAERGEPPEPVTLRTWAAELSIDTHDALASLTASDMVEAELETARITGAYPFASSERGHRVEIESGPIVQAYCAVDALGISAMLNRALTITSRDPSSGAQIRIGVDGTALTAEPPDAVVTVPAERTADQRAAGDCDCPQINFYRSATDARAYARTHGLDLDVLTVNQAHQLGVAVFGELLQPENS